ncbi:MAG: two-component sensor histidine kinase, partial [Lachnospiraceae bacterium]|nr:two-component sensor histidine kinase [Lachnospiraceae bacterium]
NIVLSVADDGVGMDDETLEKLKDEISGNNNDSGKGFGLANVNERIKMHFGKEYGMQIESQKGSGTTVKVVIPAIKKTETEVQ